MKPRTTVLAATFAQRPSSRLKCHERVFRLRSPLILSDLRVRIGRSTRLADLHTLFQYYSVEVAIDGLRPRWPLSECGAQGAFRTSPVVARELLQFIPLARLRTAEVGRADFRPFGKTIRVQLICPDQKLMELPKLSPRSEGGQGFLIAIEIVGMKYAKKETPAPPAKKPGQRNDRRRAVPGSRGR